MYIDTPANSIFDETIASLLSILCILIEVLSRAHSKGGKSLNDFNLGTFIGSFLSDGAACTAVKGLNLLSLQRSQLYFISEVCA